MRKVIVGIMVSFSLFALGAAEGDAIFRGLDETDRFTTLDRMYESADAVAAEPGHILGWNAGRCYYHGNKNAPRPSVLDGFERVVGGDHGPAFPTKKVLKAVVLVHTSEPATYFDRIDSTVAKRLKAIEEEYANLVTAVWTQDNALNVDYISDSGNAVRYGMRRVVVNGAPITIVKGVLRKAGLGLQEGDTHTLCYYFGKVQVVEPPKPETPSTPETPETLPPPSQGNPSRGSSTVISGSTRVPAPPITPYCRCFCAGPSRPIRYRGEGNVIETRYGNVPLFPANTDGTVEYRFGTQDLSSCRANIGYSCDGYESYAGGRLSGYATGRFYGCEIFTGRW